MSSERDNLYLSLLLLFLLGRGDRDFLYQQVAGRGIGRAVGITFIADC